MYNKRKIIKIGNAKGITISKDFLEINNLNIGDIVEIYIKKVE